ncbi:MAG: hypothetical protein ACR2QQ_06390 [Gammaproteobacteria bacterium]
MLKRFSFPAIFALAIGVAASASVALAESAPQNPFLADSSFPLPHGNSAQTTSAPQAGPMDPATKFLTIFNDTITYTGTGPFQFGSYTSSPYSDGRRVMWSSGGDRVVKWDHDSLDVIAQYKLPPKAYNNAGDGEKAITLLNVLPLPLKFIYMLTDLVPKLIDLSGIYSLIDSDNLFYVAGENPDGSQGITVYGDVEPGNPDSLIQIVRRWSLPDIATGPLVGMNLTFDGRIVLVTEHGWVVAVERDFSSYAITRMIFDADEDPTACSGAGFCWVRNSFAVDEEGGIYILSNDHAHKVVWTGSVLSTDEADGAWRARYSNDRGFGSGSTPSLMGFGDDPDKFVVLTDGDELMNVTLMWRDEIPDKWKAPKDAPSDRIAGMLPADMGDLALEKVQTEQSVLINGYGAAVVNNEPRNVPAELGAIDPRINALIVGFLGNEPLLQPFGIQKFEWQPRTNGGGKNKGEFVEAWANVDVSSLNGVPIVSEASSMFYTVGARNGLYTVEALDWETGGEVFHWFVGGNRFNTLYSGILINENGQIHYNTMWGKALFDPDAVSESPIPIPDQVLGQLLSLIEQDPQQAIATLKALSAEDLRELFSQIDLSQFEGLLGQLDPSAIGQLQALLASLELKLPE